MVRRRMVFVLVAAVVIGGFLVSQAAAQRRRPGGQSNAGPGGNRGGTAQDREARMAEFRRRMSDRMREQIGATEEEWKVLQPRIEKVQQLQRQGRGGFGMFGGRGGRGGRGGPGAQRQPAAGAPAREQSEVEMKTAALQSLLDDEGSSPAAIKAAITALRQAREKAAQQLAQARKELREVVTMRMEGRLLVMNILD